MEMKQTWLILGVVVAALTCHAQIEFNSMMMESTFEISGPSSERPNAVTLGTVFLLLKPGIKHPELVAYAMVTANHVLAGISGESATLNLRFKDSAGAWQKKPLSIRIRNGTNNLWATATNLDAAAILLSIPPECRPNTSIPSGVLATESGLRELEIHPGDELSCLGYPLGLECNSAGFPVLRTGTIASYPLLPIKDYPTFMFNFDTFGGNSGGPVFLVSNNRVYGGGTHVGTVSTLMGIVVEETTRKEYTETVREKRVTDTPLGISIVIHAKFIKELIDSLPEP
jgi:hypothetical protein